LNAEVFTAEHFASCLFISLEDNGKKIGWQGRQRRQMEKTTDGWKDDKEDAGQKNGCDKTLHWQHQLHRLHQQVLGLRLGLVLALMW